MRDEPIFFANYEYGSVFAQPIIVRNEAIVDSQIAKFPAYEIGFRSGASFKPDSISRMRLSLGMPMP